MLKTKVYIFNQILKLKKPLNVVFSGIECINLSRLVFSKVINYN